MDSLAAFISPSVTKERTEVILQGTVSPNASAPDAVWEDYEFKCKPGDPWRQPCLISPYHYRLDWLMWFAAFQVPTMRLLEQQTLRARSLQRVLRLPPRGS